MSASITQQFDIFAQLIATGRIESSAQILCIPAHLVSEAMNSLEDRLGCRLFHMEGQDVALTETGRKLVSALGELSLAGQEKWIDSLLSPHITHEADETHSFIHSEAEQQERTDDQVTLAPFHSTDEPDPIALSETTAPPSAPSPEELAPEELVPEELVPAYQEEKHAAQRHIILASHPAIFSHFQEALIAFEEASPDIGITLRLNSINAAQVRQLFDAKEADIAYFYALEEPEELTSRYAWSERVSLFVGKKHRLAQNDSAMADDLADTPYIALSPDNMARILAEKALANSGLHVASPLMETDNLYDIMKQVQTRPCYFAAFGSMARDFAKMPGITRLAYAQGFPQIQVRQATRPEVAQDPAIIALAEFLFR